MTSAPSCASAPCRSATGVGLSFVAGGAKAAIKTADARHNMAVRFTDAFAEKILYCVCCAILPGLRICPNDRPN